MLKEVIVVEGRSDAAAVRRALDADIIITYGFNLPPKVLEHVAAAQQKRGVIVLTDPDSAGERIRKYVAKVAPGCKHAYVPREQAEANNDIGIEQASPEAIREAIAKAHPESREMQETFTQRDMLKYQLLGQACSAERRKLLGRILGMGETNAKQFLQRLNRYGITKAEFHAALEQMEDMS